MTSEEIFPYSTLPKVQVEACPVCHTTGNPVRPATDRYGFAVFPSRCAECYLRYLTEQLTREGYARLYNGAYRPLICHATRDRSSGQHPDLATYDQLLLGAQRNYGRLLGDFVRGRVATGGSYLDAGGSSGTTVLHMGLQPARVTVLDPARQELAQAPATVQAVSGWLEDPIPGGPYDGIVCAQTMDHVTDPIAALQHCRDACPNGWLVADFACWPTDLKIDHPVTWHPIAWERALTATGWTSRVHRPVYGHGNKGGRQLSHVVTLAR